MGTRDWFSRLPARLLELASLPRWIRQLGVHANTARSAPLPLMAAHLVTVLARLDLRAGFFVDIGAGDGVALSPTLPLFRSPVWPGLAIEPDPEKFCRLSVAFLDREAELSLVRAKVTPATILDLFRACRVPQRFDVLKLDIDSYDLFVLEAILAAHRPGVIVMEVNEKVPPPLYFTVLYAEDHSWSGDHFYGCSLVAASTLLRPAGYVLESMQLDNAYFVRADLADGRIADLAPADAFREGYARRPGRRRLFTHNADMDDLLEMSPERAVAALRERFRGYEGRFILEREPPPDAGALERPDGGGRVDSQ
jgi:hypothetical protein